MFNILTIQSHIPLCRKVTKVMHRTYLPMCFDFRPPPMRQFAVKYSSGLSKMRLHSRLVKWVADFIAPYPPLCANACLKGHAHSFPSPEAASSGQTVQYSRRLFSLAIAASQRRSRLFTAFIASNDKSGGAVSVLEGRGVEEMKSFLAYSYRRGPCAVRLEEDLRLMEISPLYCVVTI